MTFHLGLFFTTGRISKNLGMVGNLDREIAVYLRMIKAGNQGDFFHLWRFSRPEIFRAIEWDWHLLQ